MCIRDSSNSPADKPEFKESHLLFKLNKPKQALAKNSIVFTIGFMAFLTASNIVVNFNAADSGLLITKAFGISPETRVTTKTTNKNNRRS